MNTSLPISTDLLKKGRKTMFKLADGTEGEREDDWTGAEQHKLLPQRWTEKQSFMKKVQKTPTKRRIKLQLRELSQRHGLMNNLLQNNLS